MVNLGVAACRQRPGAGPPLVWEGRRGRGCSQRKD